MLQQIGEFIKRVSLAEKLLYLYIVLIPVMRVPYLPLIGQKIQYTDIVFLLLFFICLIQLIKGKRDFINVPLKFSLGSMLILFIFSFVHTVNWVRSGVEYAGILYLVSVYVLLCQIVDSQETWWRLVKCWCVVSLLIALTGIVAYFISAISRFPNFLVADHEFLGNVNQQLVLRLTSIFRHPGMLTVYLHVGIVFGFVLAAEKKDGKWCSWGYLTVFLCFVAALLTKTRCNAGIALTLFCALAFMNKENIFILILHFTSFIYALVIMVLAIVLTIWWILPINFQRNLDRGTISVELNTLYQPYFIHDMAEIKIIKDFPLVGVGLGMYNTRQNNYIPWAVVRKSYQQIYPDLKEKDESVYRGTDPHSLYLGAGAEAGLLGLGGLLFFFLHVIFYFFRKIKNNEDKRESYINGVFLAGVVGFLFNGFYMDMLTVRSFWFLIAMGIIYASMCSDKKTVLAT